ncbi:DUF6923 family protein, partial [Aureibacter tunicatorum]
MIKRFTILLFLMGVVSQLSFAQSTFDGFKCSGALYQVYQDKSGRCVLSYIDVQETGDGNVTGEFIEVYELPFPSTDVINAAAYNVVDGYIYFLRTSGGRRSINRIRRDIVNDGYIVELVVNLRNNNGAYNLNQQYNNGEFDSEGVYWLRGNFDYVVTLDISTLTSGKALPLAGEYEYDLKFDLRGRGLPPTGDFVLNPEDGIFYGWDWQSKRFVAFDPSKDVDQAFTYIGGVPPVYQNVDRVIIGATYMVRGKFWGYGVGASPGELVEIDIETGELTILDSPGIQTNQNDGCSCSYVFELETSISQTDFCVGESNEFEVFFDINNKTKKDIENLELNYILPEGFVFTTNMMERRADGEYYEIGQTGDVLNEIKGETEINSSNSSFVYKYDPSQDIYRMKVGVKIYEDFKGTGQIVLGKRIFDNTLEESEQQATAMIPLFSSKHGNGFSGYDNAYADSLIINLYETPRFSDNDPLKLTRDGKVCGTEMTLDFPMSVLTAASTDLTAEEEHKVYVASILDADGLDASSKVE